MIYFLKSLFSSHWSESYYVNDWSKYLKCGFKDLPRIRRWPWKERDGRESWTTESGGRIKSKNILSSYKKKVWLDLQRKMKRKQAWGKVELIGAAWACMGSMICFKTKMGNCGMIWSNMFWQPLLRSPITLNACDNFLCVHCLFMTHLSPKEMSKPQLACGALVSVVCQPVASLCYVSRVSGFCERAWFQPPFGP